VTPDIVHEPERSRFVAHVEGETCVLDYDLEGDTMTITHVGVPDPVGGRGIAAALTRTALETARARGWRVVPQCGYAARYVREHSEWSDLVAQG
jgi:predicted GNAT family acetyltransferase